MTSAEFNRICSENKLDVADLAKRWDLSESRIYQIMADPENQRPYWALAAKGLSRPVNPTDSANQLKKQSKAMFKKKGWGMDDLAAHLGYTSRRSVSNLLNRCPALALDIAWGL